MANKTIYISDTDLWTRAKELAESDSLSLSGVIENELRKYVEEKAREKEVRMDTFSINEAIVEYDYYHFNSFNAVLNHYGKDEIVRIVNKHTKVDARLTAYDKA